MLGVDGGAYLEGLRRTLGGESFNIGFPRPPLAPGFLLWPFIELLGVDNGYKVWSSIASVLPAIPVYLLARRIDRLVGVPHPLLSPAVFAAGFLLLDMLHAEMIVTGALPLIGFALFGMVWWAMGELVERWSLPKAVILAACLGLIPWVNQTTAGLALISIPVYGAALLWFNRDWVGSLSVGKRLRPQENGVQLPAFPPIATQGTVSGVVLRLAVPLFIGGFIALGALPWYLDVLPVTGVLNYPGAFLYLSPPLDSSWLQVALTWPLGLFVIWRVKEPWLRSMGILLCLFGTLIPFLSTDESVINISYRSRYLVAIPFYAAIAWVVYTRWLPSMPSWGKKAAAGAAVAAVAVLATGYVWTFNNQAGYSDMVTRDTEVALAIMNEADDGKAIVNNSFTLALWIAALNEVEAPHTWTWAPPSNWTETYLHVRCVLGWRPECNPKESVQWLNAGWVLLEKKFPYYNSRAPGVHGALDFERPWENLPDVPWLTLVFERGTTQLWRIE